MCLHTAKIPIAAIETKICRGFIPREVTIVISASLKKYSG